MKFKRIIMICILALFVVLNSCGTAPVRGNADPPAIDIDIYADPGLDIEPETSYDNLVAYTEKAFIHKMKITLYVMLKITTREKDFIFTTHPMSRKKSTMNGSVCIMIHPLRFLVDMDFAGKRTTKNPISQLRYTYIRNLLLRKWMKEHTVL